MKTTDAQAQARDIAAHHKTEKMVFDYINSPEYDPSALASAIKDLLKPPSKTKSRGRRIMPAPEDARIKSLDRIEECFSAMAERELSIARIARNTAKALKNSDGRGAGEIEMVGATISLPPLVQVWHRDLLPNAIGAVTELGRLLGR